MKRIIITLIMCILALGLVACHDSHPEVEDLNAGARMMLEECAETHVADDEFVDTILTQVPDIYMLEDIGYACWTYFLELNDGTVFIVLTDYDGHIVSISYWNADVGNAGDTIYTDLE
jgi:hypothetical protein